MVKVAEEVVEKVVAEKPAKKTTTKKTTEVAEKPVKKTTKKATEVAEVVVEEVVEKPVKKTATKKAVAKPAKIQFLGTGRRKKSIARVRLIPGSGKVTINGSDFDSYFPVEAWRIIAKEPLMATGKDKAYDVFVNVYGGGFTGQAGAIRLGIARALVIAEDNLRDEVKRAGYLARDARVKERKHYGLKKARKASQFSKR